MNKISIIIPTYQHAKTIVSCLQSLLKQTRVPDEVIVIDDGSIDETQKAIALFLDRVRYEYQSNQGAPVARNNGFQLSSGDLVLFCDADVEMQPHMLQTLEQALIQHSDAGYAYCSFFWGTKLFRSFPFDPERLKRENYIHTSALIRRSTFPCFDPSIKRFQDWDLWLTMLEKGNHGVFVDEVLYRVRQDRRRGGISRWLPSFLYQLPWHNIPWAPKEIVAYQNARQIIQKKHGV